MNGCSSRRPIQHFFLFLGLVFFVPQPGMAAQAFRDPMALRQDQHLLLEQGWNAQDRQWFYHRNQGSRLIPYAFFLHLEQAGSRALLREPLNMLGMGLIPGRAGAYNPDALPIGFSRDGDYLGLTCAACHTQLIKYRDTFIRIDGGQALLNLPMLLGAIEDAMRETLHEEQKFQRFQRRLLGDNPRPEGVSGLRARLQAVYREHRSRNLRNRTRVPYGHSRLDAFGAILNKGLWLTGVPDNFNAPNAPTSFPYLWDTPQHDYVEWNGSQSNSDIGALARNVGEVIGVFGHVDTVPKKRWLFFDAGYASSIDIRGLRQLEKRIARLQSPLWPDDVFPVVDAAMARAGRRLYERYCLYCHQDIDRGDPKRLVKVRMSSLDAIGTDPLMARNALFLEGRSGMFEGLPRFYFAGARLGRTVPALYVVNVLMGGVLSNNPVQGYLAIRDARRLGHAREIHPPKYLDGAIIERGQEVSERALLAYKARPLNGVWSSAPFLHNGSVPTLYDLLLPEEERPDYFCLGSWEYDPVKVGYVDRHLSGAECMDTALEGNANGGHEYGTGRDGLPRLGASELMALLEYMKTL